MTDTRNFIKEMRIVEYNGSEDEWLRQSKNFIATTKVKKIANIFDGSTAVPSLSPNMNDRQKAIRELNHVAYCCLLHCMNDEICFNLVDTAKTKNLPDGDAAVAWKNLFTMLNPNSMEAC